MSEKNEHSQQYSASDIQSYLKGQMSAEEMHAMETAALDDPFLADAIEGYEAALAQGNEDTIAAGINKLNKEFSQRVNPPARVVPMPYSRWWQVAAVASIIIITAVAFYNNWIKPEQNTTSLAVIENTRSDSPTVKKQAEENALSKGFVDSFTTGSIPKVSPPLLQRLFRILQRINPGMKSIQNKGKKERKPLQYHLNRRKPMLRSRMLLHLKKQKTQVQVIVLL
ncbi:MAG: hypothetical protein ACXWCG_05290 [Flavitalea sp.]